MYLLHTQSMVNLEISTDVQVKVWNYYTDFHSLVIHTWLKYRTNMQCRNCTCTSRCWWDNSLENHQQCTQSRTVLFNCQPQNDCGCYWCCVHQAFHHQCPHDWSWPDNQRPCDRWSNTWKVLHGCTCISNSHECCIWQHHHHCNPRIQIC